MPQRLVPLVNEEYYHILNRGVNRQDIFLQPRDYRRFLQTASYYQFLGPKPKFSSFSKDELGLFSPVLQERIVEIVCYCFMPNHVHLLLKQVKDGGITIFMQQLMNSYVKYFNTKHSRSGPMFGGRFKAVLVESDEQLLHLSRYIHINPRVSKIVSDLGSYKWSSYDEYVDGVVSVCKKDKVMEFFESGAKYKEFLDDQVSYGESLEYLKYHLVAED